MTEIQNKSQEELLAIIAKAQTQLEAVNIKKLLLKLRNWRLL